MKLINIATNEVFITFEKDKLPKVTHPIIEKIMQLDGVFIPLGLQDSYHGKSDIVLSDPDFERAFREVYYTYEMDPHVFKWVD